MRKIASALAAAAFMTGSLLITAQPAFAASTNDTIVSPRPAQPPPPTIRPLDCRGTTGDMGCGPGWIWRDGWRGWACYPC
jgi:hypothetical protein